MTSFDKFEEIQLPPIEAFYIKLTDESITEEDYHHTQNVWKLFNIRNKGEYHNLYVLTDVLLLADVFENFRELCRKNYNLDCAYVSTAPELAWRACLKITDCSLQLLTDLDMHLFIERGIRGGISKISKRYAKANNKYMQDYNPNIETSYIMYLDANNLYGWAMSQPLPYGDFQWFKYVDIFTEEWVQLIADDSNIGYILEVDLVYPSHLHDSNNDYPLAPEQIDITPEMCSSYSAPFITGVSRKLVPNLRSKKNYVIYFKNLKQYLSLGLRLTKVHKVLKFKQKPWLKTYINFNTEHRKKSNKQF